jgi:ParB family chromosome partitioning protein
VLRNPKSMKGPSMQTVILVNPFRCRMWELSDRIESHITEETCRAEIESVSRHGQLVPVLGRALRGDPDYDFELIYGARRLFVARHVNKQLAVEIRTLSDRDAIVAMDIENRQRADISPYERGLSYTRWLRGGLFKSQDDIAQSLKVSASQVSRLLKLARLPSVIVNAFDSPTQICEGWGLDLIDALDDANRRQATVLRARALGNLSPRLPACEAYRQLLSASTPGRKPKEKLHDEVVKDERGGPLFRIRQQRKSIAFLLPVDRVSARMLDSIRVAITGVLLSAGSHVDDLREDVSSRHAQNSGPEIGGSIGQRAADARARRRPQISSKETSRNSDRGAIADGNAP